MACRILQKVCKTAAEAKLWGFDYVRDPETGALGFLARGWRPGQVYPADIVTLPNRAFAGLQFKSSGGQSGRREPTWPTTVGGTVTDGRVMQLTIVPEPGAIGLALLGAAIAAAVRRK